MSKAVWCCLVILLADPECACIGYSQVKTDDKPRTLPGYDHLLFNGVVMCSRCHIPSGSKAISFRSEIQIWNHSAGMRVFSTISSRDSLGFRLNLGFPAPLEGSSQCLTCHDASLARSVSSLTGTTLIESRHCDSGNPDMEMSCSGVNRHHPVSINYGKAREAGRIPLRAESTYLSGLFCDSIKFGCILSPVKTTGSLLEKGKVECKSCHAVHSNQLHNLRITNKNSQLCLACHVY
ncbi:MAG: cytochrome c3 family protein [Bacteroidia bacterium]